VSLNDLVRPASAAAVENVRPSALVALIQHELELRGLLHGEVSWLGALEYFVDELCGVQIHFWALHTVDCKTAFKGGARVHGR
jgi:hypothetical protein